MKKTNQTIQISPCTADVERQSHSLTAVGTKAVLHLSVLLHREKNLWPRLLPCPRCMLFTGWLMWSTMTVNLFFSFAPTTASEKLDLLTNRELALFIRPSLVFMMLPHQNVANMKGSHHSLNILLQTSKDLHLRKTQSLIQVNSEVPVELHQVDFFFHPVWKPGCFLTF